MRGINLVEGAILRSVASYGSVLRVGDEDGAR